MKDIDVKSFLKIYDDDSCMNIYIEDLGTDEEYHFSSKVIAAVEFGEYIVKRFNVNQEAFYDAWSSSIEWEGETLSLYVKKKED